MNPKTQAKALDALEGMRQIVANEAVIKGAYVHDDFDPARASSVCRGHKYCAIGALWAGAGVVAESDGWGGFELKGVYQDDRAPFLRRRPALRVAYDALNAAAQKYIERHGITEEQLDDEYGAPVEALFEGSAGIGRPELLKLIKQAKRRVKEAA